MSKRAWISKAVLALNAGGNLSLTDAEVDRTMAMPFEAVIEAFMTKPAFTDSVLDFNLFFLGFKPTQLTSLSSGNGTKIYDQLVYRKPQAIAAAQAVSRDEDYLVLFDLKQKIYSPSIQITTTSATPNTDKLSNARLKMLADINTVIDAFYPNGRANQIDREAGCRVIADDNGIFMTMIKAPINAGFAPVFTSDTLVLRANEIQVSCSTGISATEIIAGLTNFVTVIQHFFDLGTQLTDDNYKIFSVDDIKGFDPESIGTPNASGQFNMTGFWLVLTNSSTNFSRKRAAYMLNTFFCDDLTPINVTVPESHGEQRHAADPACQSCHYKLDPMAGFFASRGHYGIDMQAHPAMIFDDLAILNSKDHESYMNSWTVRGNATHPKNIGYIRSNADDSINEYGESLDKLMATIRTAPEAGQCLTRRLAEYYIGSGQVFDTAWLNDLAKRFATEATTARAYKSIVKTMLTSATFMQSDPDPDTCYDFAEITDNAIPCEIAATLKTNCSSCHSSTSGSGHLDLTRWTTAVEAEGNFPHLDADGHQKARQATLEAIAGRLSTSDATMAMPPNRFMSVNERTRLYKWVNKAQSVDQKKQL